MPCHPEQSMLFVSFWKISLSNLPEGGFVHRVISPAAASELVTAARSTEILRCVSQDDLAAPYRKRELERHRKLCAALAVHGVQVTIADFVGPSFINPLDFAKVRDGQRLLVVDAGYGLAAPASSSGLKSISATDKTEAADVQSAFGSLFELAPDTITFHLIEST
jgi:hypothetical protein